MNPAAGGQYRIGHDAHQTDMASAEHQLSTIATEEEKGVSELKRQHVQQWSEVAKIGKQWRPDTRKAQECLLIQLYFLRFLDELHNEEAR